MTYNVTFPHLGLEFNINPVAFSIGNFHVYWYGIIIAAGFLLALIYASFSCKKMNIDINRLFDVVIVGLITGVIFARCFMWSSIPVINTGKTPWRSSRFTTEDWPSTAALSALWCSAA